MDSDISGASQSLKNSVKREGRAEAVGVAPGGKQASSEGTKATALAMGGKSTKQVAPGLAPAPAPAPAASLGGDGAPFVEETPTGSIGNQVTQISTQIDEIS